MSEERDRREHTDRTGAPRREAQERDLLLEGKNAVREAFAAEIPIQRIWMLRNDEKGAMTALRKTALERGIPIREIDRAALDRISRTGHHQGVIAETAAVSWSSLENCLALAEERREDLFLLILDGIEDPHNFGAIIRAAECFGAHGVVVARDRSAPLSETVMRASAGALHHVPVVRVTNLVRTLEELKKQSLWFACADMDGRPCHDAPLTGPLGLVIGSEGRGVSRLVKEHCDFTVSVPMKGRISSLNASMAAGILAAEVMRQRDASAATPARE